MKEQILEAAIWYSGVLAWLITAAAVTLAVAWFAFLCTRYSAVQTMRFVRYETARYWIARMEKEGLTIAQTEYRRMVKERNPKTVAEFAELNDEVGSPSKEQQ